jgi:large subunit ribosomal protein L21
MKAVIKVGGKQYIVAEKETILVDRLAEDTKTLELEPLLVIDGDKATVGAPIVKGVKVSAKVLGEEKGDKLHIVHFKSKKREKTITGHRQKYSRIEISKIAA